jgi:hypothetical protein
MEGYFFRGRLLPLCDANELMLIVLQLARFSMNNCWGSRHRIPVADPTPHDSVFFLYCELDLHLWSWQWGERNLNSYDCTVPPQLVQLEVIATKVKVKEAVGGR